MLAVLHLKYASRNASVNFKASPRASTPGLFLFNLLGLKTSTPWFESFPETKATAASNAFDGIPEAV